VKASPAPRPAIAVAGPLGVTGLRAELRLLPPGYAAACAGGDPVRLAALLHASGPVSGVLSFGIAGGLEAGLRSGSVVVADTVRGPRGMVHRADPRWSDAIMDALLGAGLTAARGALAGADAVVAEPAGKRVLFGATGALAVDLESAVAAEFALARGVPFAAVRVVADAAADRLPRAAVVGLRADGRPAVLRVLAAIAARPQDIRDLVRTARRARIALDALRRAGLALGGVAVPRPVAERLPEAAPR